MASAGRASDGTGRFPRLALVFSLFLACGGVHAADIARGAQTFAMHCAVCHGPAGQGVHPTAPRLDRGERLLQSDLALLDAVRRGKKAMPPFNGVLRDREILDVVAYMRTLQR